MTTVVAIALAVAGAVCFGFAAYLQHDAVHSEVLRRAVRRPGWLAGIVLIGAGAGLHAVALGLAPLVVVQPIGVLALPLVAALHAKANRVRLGTAPRLAIAATAVGVALFVTVAATAVVPGTPPLDAYARAGWFAALAVTGLTVVGALTRASRRCLALAAAAGVAFALVSVLIRAIGQHLGDAAVWSIPPALPLGIAGALAAGGVLVQLGYASGPPAVVVACLTIVDPLVSVGAGIGLLGEASAAAPWTVPLGAACALVALAGTVALALQHPEVTATRIPEEISCT